MARDVLESKKLNHCYLTHCKKQEYWVNTLHFHLLHPSSLWFRKLSRYFCAFFNLIEPSCVSIPPRPTFIGLDLACRIFFIKFVELFFCLSYLPIRFNWSVLVVSSIFPYIAPFSPGAFWPLNTAWDFLRLSFGFLLWCLWCLLLS